MSWEENMITQFTSISLRCSFSNYLSFFFFFFDELIIWVGTYAIKWGYDRNVDKMFSLRKPSFSALVHSYSVRVLVPSVYELEHWA